MEMPRPTAAHLKLGRLAGSWHGEERMLPSPWDPAGGTAIGHVRNVRALDGFGIVQDYEQERGGGVTFRGHGVFWWDGSSNTYVLHWFDTMGQPPNEFRGTFDGDVLTLVSHGLQGQARATWDFSTPARYVHRLEMSGDGVHWQALMEGTYTKDA
jgi:hypothetical protein